ncbi:O-antigen ligase family protein [Bradyrhizobium cenepequi]
MFGHAAPPASAALLASVISTGPIAVLAHGLFGTGSTFTGLLMVITTGSLLVLGCWREFEPNLCDVLFGLFAACVAVSFVINGIGPNRNEVYLFVISVAAFPAARALPKNTLSPTFLVGLAVITALGTITTSFYLVEQWHDNHGKPLLFGKYDAAPTQFTMLLGLLIIALACAELRWRRSLLIVALTSLPAMVFSASIVRFSFGAILVALTIVFLLSKQRKQVVVIACGLLVSITVGATIRSGTTFKFLDHAVNVIAERPIAERPETDAKPTIAAPTNFECPPIDLDNSIAIRKQLYADAFRILPDSGLFGIGLDNFTRHSCVKDTEAHNSILQAAIEFGWPAGAALVLLVFSVVRRKLPALAEIDTEARFVLCGLVFALMLSVAHGRISRDGTLFLFLGYAANLLSKDMQTAKTWLARPAQFPGP